MPTVADLAAAIRERSAPRVGAILREAPALAAARPAGNPSPLLLAVYVNAPDILALLRPHVMLDVCEAAAAGDVERLRTLLAGDAAQVHARSGDGWTPLHLAAFFGRREAVDLLLARGAPVSAVSGGQEHNQPLHAALAGACDGVIVRALVTAGADVNAAGAGGVTPLHVAASRGNAEQVRFLRTAGASVTATLDDGRTPAKLAAAHGHPTLAEELRSPV
jgi:ankyrin repeat protein